MGAAPPQTSLFQGTVFPEKALKPFRFSVGGDGWVRAKNGTQHFSPCSVTAHAGDQTTQEGGAISGVRSSRPEDARTRPGADNVSHSQTRRRDAPIPGPRSLVLLGQRWAAGLLDWGKPSPPFLTNRILDYLVIITPCQEESTISPPTSIAASSPTSSKLWFPFILQLSPLVPQLASGCYCCNQLGIPCCPSSSDVLPTVRRGRKCA